MRKYMVKKIASWPKARALFSIENHSETISKAKEEPMESQREFNEDLTIRKQNCFNSCQFTKLA